MSPPRYRGRLAPSPTGYLHVGHAKTFWIAWQRARRAGGTLVLRNEDLDPDRSQERYAQAILDDLRWLGLDWDEGPDCGGAFAPYHQSQRASLYAHALSRLQQQGLVYPCWCSRKDIRAAIAAPHLGEEEPPYPGTCRPATIPSASPHSHPGHTRPPAWRFAVPIGQSIRFQDAHLGPQCFVAGKDFGDFVVWRPDGVPAYQLAVVVDDATMGITEVVRGADLLLSTARQILLFHALDWPVPFYFHCPLVTDEHGARLAKRHAALSLRNLRDQGVLPETLRQSWNTIEAEPQTKPGLGNR